MALPIYSRSPYLMTLGQHAIPKPLWQFARIVIRHGVQGAWKIVSLLVGVGLVGVLGWALTRPLTAVLLAIAAFVVLVLAIGSYRAWLAAARFVPTCRSMRSAEPTRSPRGAARVATNCPPSS